MSPAALAAEVARAALTHGPALIDAVGRLLAIFARSPGEALEVQRARGLELDSLFDEVDARLRAQGAPTDRPPPAFTGDNRDLAACAACAGREIPAGLHCGICGRTA